MKVIVWFICIQFLAFMFVATRGQPTMQEYKWGSLGSKQCGPESLTSLQSTFNALRNEVRSQVTESKKLRLELSMVAEHNRQSRNVLAKLIETVHTFVTKMAVKYPCDCAAANVPIKNR